jgi:ATP-dependent RNA helicase DBP3
MGGSSDKSSKKERKERKEKKEKKEKKPKKDKKDRLTERPADTITTTKKAKVHKHGSNDGMAEVGSRDLAKKLRPIVKDLYEPSSDILSMSDKSIDAFREERRMAVENCDAKPLSNFKQSGLSKDELYATRNFTMPSPIQSQCLPIALSGRDLVGIAATGSGKTLAFGLPAIKHIRAQIDAGVASGTKPVALVIAPTRELALQISVVLEEAGSKVGVGCVCVYGGVPKREQAQALRSGVSIVVATPGRLEDLIGDGICSLDEVTYLVLDEADRMLDLGFEPHIRTITGSIRADRQTLMFSATWPSSIRKLASEFLCNPARVTIGSEDLAASHTVKQIIEVVDGPSRDRLLDTLLNKYHSSRKNRIIIFVLYKKEAARVESMLQRRGWNAVAVHGDISQAQRTAAVESFKSGEVPLLVATDVAARGLDIPDVEAVINYSFPLTTEDYVHRIGRTGRAGKSGIAHTMFVGANDKPRAGELINVLKEANQKVPEELLAFGTTVKKKESKLYGAHFKDVDFSVKSTKVTFDSDSD